MNFLMRVREALTRFFYGRNGVDALCWALLVLEMVLSVIGRAVGGAVGGVLYWLSLALWAVLMWRMLSRNVYKRREENTRFLRLWHPMRAKAKGMAERRRDTQHKYFRCRCGAYCRVPRGVGRVEITCPKCRTKMTKKA